ncbi:MAG: NADH-quinone oxidoreductase subunit K [Candidatus Bathyarchaeia archaeon]|jgi:multicomponent Na+:H+ antiporter subunit C
MNEQQLLQVFAALLFVSGFGTIATTKNLVKMIMGFQVMIWGVNLALFAGGLVNGQVTLFSTSLVIISISIGASVEALALSLVILVFRRYGTLNPWEIRRLAH